MACAVVLGPNGAPSQVRMRSTCLPTAPPHPPQLNKALLSSYRFDGYFTLLFVQLVITLAVCEATRRYGGNPLNIPSVTTDLLVR
jgi:hypothetical protein